jgi:ABC-type Mn2+/Zn2+ transport system permease subunit
MTEDAAAGPAEAEGWTPRRLRILFLVVLGLLVLVTVSAAGVSAVDSLLANPAQGCGGP